MDAVSENLIEIHDLDYSFGARKIFNGLNLTIKQGQVTAIMPVTIDFGLLQMEDANWTNDESLVGRHVMIAIDRLELVSADQPDWPEEIC